MLILTASDVRQALPMDKTIQAMKRAYSAFSAGRAEVPLRSRLEIIPHEATSLVMPAFLQDEQGEALVIKVVSLFPNNHKRGLPLINAAVLVLEPETGRIIALLEASTLTAIRTGAASGAATDLLARPDSSVVAIFGAGIQGRTQLEAICTVRPIIKGWIYDPVQANVDKLISEMAGQGPIPIDLRAATSPTEALIEADIISTATTSHTPVFDDVDLQPGTHINGIGSYTPLMQEIPPQTVSRALVVIDSRSACLSEAGDLIQPIRQGLISPKHISLELGEVILGINPGRTSPDQVTFFKSVGLAVQDAAAACLALEQANLKRLGQHVEW